MELDDGVGVFSEREVLAPPAARADAAPEAVAAEDQALEDATLLLTELKAIRASQEKLLKEMEAMRTDMRQSFHALSTGKIIPLKGDAVPKKPEKTEQEKKKRKCKTCRKCAKDCTVCTHRCGCQPRAIILDLVSLAATVTLGVMAIISRNSPSTFNAFLVSTLFEPLGIMALYYLLRCLCP